MLNVSLEHSFNLSNAVQVEGSQISQLEFYVYIASEGDCSLRWSERDEQKLILVEKELIFLFWDVYILCFCEINKFQNLSHQPEHCCIMKVALLVIPFES